MKQPLEDEEFRKKYHLVELDLTSLTKEALKDSPLNLQIRHVVKFLCPRVYVLCLWSTA